MPVNEAEGCLVAVFVAHLVGGESLDGGVVVRKSNVCNEHRCSRSWDGGEAARARIGEVDGGVRIHTVANPHRGRTDEFFTGSFRAAIDFVPKIAVAVELGMVKQRAQQ